MSDYEEELKASNDEAWFYHNCRGTHFTPEWGRIINGIYLWASPFRAHIPWTYQSFRGNPFDDLDGGDRAHDFGFSCPGVDDAADLIPTRIWEAMREGFDDIRYIATLEDLIQKRGKDKPKETVGAQEYLAKLRSVIRDAKVSDVTVRPEALGGNEKGEIDLDTGIVMGTGVVGSAAEAPLINAMAARFSGDDWQRIRREIARHIIALQMTP